MKNNINFIVKKKSWEKYVLTAVLCIAILIGLVIDVNGLPFDNKNDVVEGLSDSLIRFHVIANSDSDSDQELKLLVKDQVVKEMEGLLQSSESIEESREIIINNMASIKAIAENVVAENGQDTSVAIALQEESFPIKKYGDIVLPAGKYEALVIRLGEAKGKNWWCILFPPLCFVDATHGVIDDETKASLEEVLTEEEYNEIIMSEDSDIDITVRFKIVEWLKEKEEETIDINALAKIFE